MPGRGLWTKRTKVFSRKLGGGMVALARQLFLLLGDVVVSRQNNPERRPFATYGLDFDASVQDFAQTLHDG